MAAGIERDGHESDPERGGYSLRNVVEMLTGCLNAIGARSVVEVGAFAGDLTEVLLDWGAGAGARVTAIEPAPMPRLVELADQRAELELIRETSHDALRHLSLPDAVIIDGDHNYYTVSEELRLIGELASGAEIPLLALHDVGWPHGRRDTYWAPERIPEEHRQPVVAHPTLFPGEPGVAEGGLPMYSSAEREGGARNGVLTALEDFLEQRQDLRLAILPPFFGLGVVWRRDTPWADAVAEIVEPWDRNPVLERLEADRVYHIATSRSRSVELGRVNAELERLRSQGAELESQRDKSRAELENLRERSSRQEHVLRALLASGGLRLADRVSALRHPRRDWSWPGRLRRALGEDRRS